MPACVICGNVEGNTTHAVREMMFGFREAFAYMECAACGCVQLLDPPGDLSKYYPDDYYAFLRKPDGPLKALLRRRRMAYAMGRRGPLGRLLVARYGLPALAEWIRLAGMQKSDAILDVGCGLGWLLQDMARNGFTNLTGVDPHIEHDIHYPSGVTVLKRELSEVEGRFDRVMMHHSFEHMADPYAVLREIHRLLAPGGTLLIRIPVAAHAWKEYGPDWVQIDAPRHFFLHTKASMEVLAGRTGFRITDVVFDSGAFQFIGSEQYRRDIPFCDERSYFVHPERSIFSKDQAAAFERQAAELNRRGEGDAAGFYLRREQ